VLNCNDAGSGDPVLLLHGIPGSQRTWNDVAALLRTVGLRAVVPDLLGFGGSPDGSAAPHAFEQAGAVLTAMDHLEIDSAHVAGFDFGGPVAVAAYALAPDRFRSMTLIATNLLTSTPVPLPLRIARVPAVGELAFAALFSPFGAGLLWRFATVQRRSFPHREFRQGATRRNLRTTRRIFLRSLREMVSLYGPVEENLPMIDIPATVVWAGRDPFFPVVAGRETASRFRDAIFIVLEDCGHFVPNERPHEVAAAIEKNIRRAFPTERR
jgi:pimeloyl-ACP methyl ester carboxylesterase